MKFDMKRPIATSGGNIAALVFSRVSVAGMLELASSGDILSPEASALYASKYGKAIDPNGAEFELSEEDITGCNSPAPAIACAVAFSQARQFSKELISGEVIAVNPFNGGNTSIKLAHPIQVPYVVGVEERSFPLEWLTFEPKKYSETVSFVRAYLSNSPDTIVEFLKSFATMMNVPEDYPLKRMTDKVIDSLDCADAERIAELVMPGFIELPNL